VGDIDVTPPLEDGERRALLLALEGAEPRERAGEPYRQAWRVAGLLEGVDDEADVSYAFSPRSTRGATRA
jgi:hypothetical protein